MLISKHRWIEANVFKSTKGEGVCIISVFSLFVNEQILF